MSEALRLLSLAFGFGVAFSFIMVQAVRKGSALEVGLILLGLLIGALVFSR